MSGGPARAQPEPLDHSLRIGTFNAWMLPPPGWGVEIPAFAPCGPVPYCLWGERGPYISLDVPPPCNWACELGVHATFDEDEILAGAVDLADRIRKSGYDVIVLNELFGEFSESALDTATAVLVEELKNDYPFIVHSIGEDDFLEPFELSGLALFSKLPFQLLPEAYDPDYVFYSTATMMRNGANEDDPWRFLAFKEFEDCDGDDCVASKGVAYVRVSNPETGRIHNIFWTHMQSSYQDDVDDDPKTWHGLDERESQLEEIATMIEVGETPGPGAINRAFEDIFVLGDLNVDGDLSNKEDSLDPPQVGNLGEWSRYFAPGTHWGSGIFVDVLHDVWANQHILADTLPAGEPSEFGHTTRCWSQADGDCRVDYILHNSPALSDISPVESKLCNQHPHLAYNLDSGGPLEPGANPPGGRGDLSDGLAGEPSADFRSDHIGVVSHYNRPEPQCSPLSPQKANLVYGDPAFGVYGLSPAEIGNTTDGDKDYANEAQLLEGSLNNPGSVQWWRIEDPGAYLVGFDLASEEAGYQAMVFSASSLSVPSRSYREDVFAGLVEDGEHMVPIVGPKYVFDEPPYYIKIFHPAHEHTGTYRFGVRRLGCTNKVDDACPLLPNTPMEYAFPDVPIQSSPTIESLYFTLHVEPLTVPDTQQLELVAFSYANDSIESAVVVPDVLTDDLVTQGTDVKHNRGFDHRLLEEGFTTGSPGYGQACPPGIGPMAVPELTGCNNRITWHHPQPPGLVAQERIWRVTRTADAPLPLVHTPVSVVWTTDLTAFYGKEHAAGSFQGMRLVCVAETSDGSPHDEIGIRMDVDGQTMVMGGVTTFDQIEIAEFQKDSQKVIDPFLDSFGLGPAVGFPFRYKDKITLTLTERDPGPSWQIGIEDVGVLGRNAFGPSSAQTDPPAVEEWTPDEGSYTMPFLLSHGTQRIE